MLASLAAGGGRGAAGGAGGMRELDAEAPVVWPAWCYSAEGGVVGSNERARAAAAVAAAARRCARVQSPHQSQQLLQQSQQLLQQSQQQLLQQSQQQLLQQSQHQLQQLQQQHQSPPQHALPLAPVKSERLSPPQNHDNRSSVSRSRSVTPSTSSYPGTPPERDASPAAPVAPAPARNYSDIMRSLAARYNHAPAVSASNDCDLSERQSSVVLAPHYRRWRYSFFHPARANGFASSLDARLGLAKAAAGALLAPGGPLARGSPAAAAAGAAGAVGAAVAAARTSPGCAPDGDAPVGGLFAGFSGGLGRPQRVPAFPAIMDMSSTKALLAIAKAARGGGACGGARARARERARRGKRAAAGARDHSPLDLSAGALHAKRERRASGGSSRTASPARDDDRRSDTESREERAASAAAGGGEGGARVCACAGPGCERLAAWTVDDVCEFVQSIDICAEYSPKFREQRIDGSGLPLLTEEHLTGMLHMKLGPALKLQATLRKRLAACQQCTAPSPRADRHNGSAVKSEPNSHSDSPS